jgi:hypothetical protein
MRYISRMKQQSRQETILYIAMWAMLFVAPILSMYVSIVSGERDSRLAYPLVCIAEIRHLLCPLFGS